MRAEDKLFRTSISSGIVRFFLLLAVVFSVVQSPIAAPTEDNRPFVLVVYADWCPSCQQLKPVLAHINEKYQKRIRFVRYDITSEETAARSKEEVAKLGLADFFEKNHEQTSLVVILDSSHKEVFRTANNYDPQPYDTVLDQLLKPR
jgi:thiol-disulfide isomerase/thioredoxin